MWLVCRFINQNHKYLYGPHFVWISPHIFPWIHYGKEVISYLCEEWYIKKINFLNEQAWQSVLVGTRSLLRVRRCVVASLFNLSVPNGRAKASKLLNHPALGRPHVACSQLGDNPLAPNQSFRLIFGGGAKIFHFIFFSGFIYDHCHLEYP